VTLDTGIEGLLRDLTPRVLGAVVRRYGNFTDAEDAVQEALLTAATAWPEEGLPEHPSAWLIRVASRRMADQFRSDEARRRREDLAASWSIGPPDPATGHDDTLILFFMCCHPSLSPASAIALTLRAVGGLTTREIAAAFLVPEATMAQRISRAKATLSASGEGFALPSAVERTARQRSVLHVLYLLFNEGYASSSGPDLTRSDLSGEAIRLARIVCTTLPEDAEVTGLLALMLLTDARRPARTDAVGQLVPLAEQDRSLWDRDLITEGVALVTESLRRGLVGEYQAQAAIAAVHDQSPTYADTDWSQILPLYRVLQQMSGNPMVTLNLAVAVAMVEGPQAGLAMLEELEGELGAHYRFHAVRAHLLELGGNLDQAVAAFRAAAASATNLREQNYLITKAARLKSAGAT
jgi:RNA polymerase sigma factor (sigma-70 family)